MDDLLQSFGLVLASEMGDKTQLLALVLTLRFKKPMIVMLGILIATLANHGLASFIGGWIGLQFSESTLRTVLSILFLCFAIWILVPDKLEENENSKSYSQANALIATTVLFFLAEMGDKTQLATLALGAKFQSPVFVTLGTTLGMLVADGLAVVFGERLTKIIPMKAIRIFSSILFALFGLALLWQ